MKTAIQRIIDEAIHLPPIERAELLEKIIESFDAAPDDGIQKAWAEEAERRLALQESGDDATFSEEEAFARIETEDKK